MDLPGVSVSVAGSGTAASSAREPTGGSTGGTVTRSSWLLWGGEKGRGLVASQRIQWGEEILREQPLLLINNSSSLLAWSDTVLGLVRDLAEKERRQLEELADNSGLADTAEFLYLRGVRGLSEENLRTLRIIRTNGINLAEDGDRTGLYLRFSRVNHSCAPAAVRNIEPTTGSLSLIAARDIEKGEEITIKVEEN